MAQTRERAPERRDGVGRRQRLLRLRRLAASRAVRAGLVGWVATNVLLLALSGEHLPFRADRLAQGPAVGEVLQTNLMFLEVFALMAVVSALTRHRPAPDLADRLPDRRAAGRETLLTWVYGVLAMTGGYALARSFGWHAFGFHLDGMIIPTGQPVVPREALCWAAYNLGAYAVLPFWYFRRRYTGDQLALHSSNRRADLVLVLVVLLL